MEEDNVSVDHIRLVEALSVAQGKREWVLAVTADERLSKILRRFEAEIETTKESLVDAEKKDVEGKQHSVRARRDLLAQLRHAYEDEAKEAKLALEKFEEKHALFLQGKTAKLSKRTG